MNNRTRFLGPVIAGILLISSFINAEALNLSGPFGHHGASGGRYCLFRGGICWNSTGVGDASRDAPAGSGNLDAFVVNRTQIHFVFHHNLDLDPASNGLFPVDEDTRLSDQVSQALGYSKVILLAGNYPVDFSKNQFGEVTVNAVFTNHGLTFFQWGIIIIIALLVLAVAGTLYLKRRRRPA